MIPTYVKTKSIPTAVRSDPCKVVVALFVSTTRGTWVGGGSAKF